MGSVSRPCWLSHMSERPARSETLCSRKKSAVIRRFVASSLMCLGPFSQYSLRWRCPGAGSAQAQPGQSIPPTWLMVSRSTPVLRGEVCSREYSSACTTAGTPAAHFFGGVTERVVSGSSPGGFCIASPFSRRVCPTASVLPSAVRGSADGPLRHTAPRRFRVIVLYPAVADGAAPGPALLSQPFDELLEVQELAADQPGGHLCDLGGAGEPSRGSARLEQHPDGDGRASRLRGPELHLSLVRGALLQAAPGQVGVGILLHDLHRETAAQWPVADGPGGHGGPDLFDVVHHGREPGEGLELRPLVVRRPHRHRDLDRLLDVLSAQRPTAGDTVGDGLPGVLFARHRGLSSGAGI